MPNNTPKLVVSRTPGNLHDLAHWATEDLVRLPFKSVLSLVPLIEFWERTGSEQGMVGSRILYERIRRELERHPELAAPIEEASLLAKHHELLDLLMMPVFPPAFRDNDISAALVPFESRAFYSTPASNRFLIEEDGRISTRINLDSRTFIYGRIITAYLHILRSVYRLDVPFEFPLLFTLGDPETGLDRYFKITADLRFLKINQIGEAPTLTEEMKNRLLTNLADLETWTQLIPPDTFELTGFDIIRAIDVTDVEVVSLLERDLLEGESMLSGTAMSTLRERMRVLLRQADVHLGLVAVDGGALFRLHRVDDAFPTCLFTQTSQYDLAASGTSLFARALRQRAMQIVEDLEEYPRRTAMEDEMLKAGVRTVIAAPLFFQEKAVGVLYLWSDKPGELTALNMMKLMDVLPLFSAAMKRGREELRNRVQATILNEYTSIHPSVEWRFRQAALNYIRRQEQGIPAEVEPIVFRNVYALFAAADIRGSSTHRNQAVMADLMEHLATVSDLLRQAHEVKPIPILDYLLVRTQQHAESLHDGMSSGEEANIRDFLIQEIEPVFEHLKGNALLRDQIEDYFQALDPQQGRMYRRHREFDESVTEINRTIAAYLEAEEAKAQAAFPHYFEKHQTDGVEFTIYVGASLVENGDFDELYVRNLRLWQLMVLCGIAQRVAALKDTLKVPLETTHLVLTQSSPLAIRFRFDETRFDVDGTHHIRYEIMKQRIEKALLKGRDERLTQPGKIAIVYSQAREAWEYADYIRFLQEAGYLTDEVEDVELSDLQGMVGLKALRVTVALDRPAGRMESTTEAAERPTRTLPTGFTEASRN